MSEPDRPPSHFKQLIWFVALWSAGVGTVTLVSLLLRAWIGGR